MNGIIQDNTVAIRKQIVAPRTIIDWDSASGAGTIRFETKVEVSHDGSVVGYEASPAGDFNVSLADLLPLTLDVQGTPVPAALVMGAVKAAFEHFLANRS